MNPSRLLAALACTSLLVGTAFAANTGFLEGEAQEVIVKVRTADGKVKWYKVQPDGKRQELDMTPGNRYEFLYEESVDLNAVTVRQNASAVPGAESSN